MQPPNKNDTIIFQHILSNSEYMQAAEFTVPRALRYCRLHKMDYRLIVGRVTKYAGMDGHWEVPALFDDFLEQGYQNVIYFDSDTLISNLEPDMRTACVSGKIGAVWHDLSYWPEFDHSCYNVGALYATNSPEVRDFVKQWMECAPGSGEWPWWENGAFNVLGGQMDVINRLDNCWNAQETVSPSDHPVVSGFHGMANRIEVMRNCLLTGLKSSV